MNYFEMVREFHETFKQPIGKTIGLTGRMTLRRKILREEWNEYEDAHENHDITELADALADMVYIACGTAVEFGIPFDDVFAEVHRANMSKLMPDGTPLLREDGKVMKGPDYTPPNIKKILFPERENG